MELYKCDGPDRAYRGGSRYDVFGYITDKVVDGFNGPLKVFIPIASRDLSINLNRWSSKCEGIRVDIEDGENDWRHLSTCDKPVECTKGERKAILSALEDLSKQTYGELLAIRKLIEDIK